jgi:hypothetical protein
MLIKESQSPNPNLNPKKLKNRLFSINKYLNNNYKFNQIEKKQKNKIN